MIGPSDGTRMDTNAIADAMDEKVYNITDNSKTMDKSSDQTLKP